MTITKELLAKSTEVPLSRNEFFATRNSLILMVLLRNFKRAGDLGNLKREAVRLDRSLSWVAQRAWMLAREQLREIPSVNGLPGGADDSRGRDE